MNKQVCAVAAVMAAAGSAFAGIAFQADFASYSSGNLVGQDGWVQTGASTTNPVQVSGGQVQLPGLGTGSGDGQDARRNFTPVLSTAGTSVYTGVQVNVTSVLAPNSSATGSSYLIGVLTSDAGAFVNMRVATRQGTAPDTFQIGLRPTGQTGNSFVFGGDLPLNTLMTVIVGWDFVAGAQNDVTRVWVNASSSDRASNAVYLTNNQLNASGDAPGFGGVVISQFTNATTTQAGASFSRMIVATEFAEVQGFIPSPGAASVLAVGGLLAARRRRA